MTPGEVVGSPTRVSRLATLTVAAAVLFNWSVAAQGSAAQYDTTLYQAMEWRNIGPFRGGRSEAVAGVPSDNLTYYFGGTGGGVWKTTDAGITWTNISDGFFKTGSVGAIAVAGSDPNVVYVGMGEHAVRGVTTSHGDGVYKSTDAGKTWKHLGLDRTRAISRIRVHPHNPDLVYVAAQGAPYGPTEERGIYRSKDGGETWDLVLHVDETTGASDLAMDRTNPRILYAAFWDHLRRPWVVRSGGPGSAIYKSTDGGDNWEKLTKGLPSLMGKVSVDVSPANPERVWAIVEADSGGLFRSDDAGKSWKRLNSERVLRARAWYYIEVFADPQDEETVYVLNAPVLRSIDGGKTFTQIPIAHGDTHDLWINPNDNRILINANDGGATISFNGGKTWSTQENQPTAQFYRVNTDHRFPYWLYAGQQDNSSVAIASRTTDNVGIGWKDWFDAGGGEAAYVAFDPDNPVLLYATDIQGVITELDTRTKDRRSIQAYPFFGLGMDPVDMRYRFNWNAPVITSPHDPKVIYHAGNKLLRSDDRGATWTEMSPDLTRNEQDKQGKGGVPITNEAAGGEVYNTIFYVTESPLAQGTIWTGSDDGLVHLTRDGGATWEDVTPKDVGVAMINSIEASPHDAGSAYLAVTKYKFNDFTPHIYKTSNYGKSWKEIVSGIKQAAWVRVVREDPVRRGLLYAGTETGAYVSFDDGGRWQSLQLNLPIVPITDLKVEQNDLVAATQGRAFWILDDLSPLQQLTDEVASSSVHLFQPARTYRVGGGTADRPRLGKNPPNGARLFYSLARVPDSTVTLEILDGGGRVVRAFDSDTTKKRAAGAAKPISVRAGLNLVVWDLRHEAPPPIEGLNLGFFGGQGYRVKPGNYTARLTVSGAVQTRSFEVAPDPRLDPGVADYDATDEFLQRLNARIVELHQSVARLESVRGQIENLVGRVKDLADGEEIANSGKTLGDSMRAVEERLVQFKRKTPQDIVNFPPQLNMQLTTLMGNVDGTDYAPRAGAIERLNDLSAEWARVKVLVDELLGPELDKFNGMIRDKGVGGVILPRKKKPNAVS
ncbi:MAG: WD40/YVTN/BNR-like repeat-containing protein [Gemmatimonadales bacterium]